MELIISFLESGKSDLMPHSSSLRKKLFNELLEYQMQSGISVASEHAESSNTKNNQDYFLDSVSEIEESISSDDEIEDLLEESNTEKYLQPSFNELEIAESERLKEKNLRLLPQDNSTLDGIRQSDESQLTRSEEISSLNSLKQNQFESSILNQPEQKSKCAPLEIDPLICAILGSKEAAESASSDPNVLKTREDLEWLFITYHDVKEKFSENMFVDRRTFELMGEHLVLKKMLSVLEANKENILLRDSYDRLNSEISSFLALVDL